MKQNVDEKEFDIFVEYRDICTKYKYSIETERRFYLANKVDLKPMPFGKDCYFECNLKDAWVWDVYREDRFLKTARIVSFRDINVEEIS
jgi:hypothetical protein